MKEQCSNIRSARARLNSVVDDLFVGMIMIDMGTRRTTFRLITFVTILFFMGVTLLAIRSSTDPRAAFKRLAIRPIPQSVHRIKADRFWKIISRARDVPRDHVQVLRFDVSRDDLMRIVEARGLRQSTEGAWLSGMAHWEIAREGPMAEDHVIKIYTGQPPSWFDLERWTSFETYYLEQPDQDWHHVTDVTIVYYNEEVGGACFIKWERRLPGP